MSTDSAILMLTDADSGIAGSRLELAVDVVGRYLVDVVDRYLVDVVDRQFQRKRFQLGLIALTQVLLQIADLSSLFSSSKLRSEMDFEFPSSGVH
ncbi:hypothetical protein DY000_02049119 [Brassica cretica]|uniref:Uncharacterized protein n=1 Tax=Brassica cretica TaxID=69181 RepID=A0ABQ7EN39_BRACR|nr:hypothetical protein DY000_02049119 [Brassica cretica]